MKSRIIFTKFWEDNYITTLSHIEKLAFIYFLTNSKANLLGIYELPDKYIMLDLDITKEELEALKTKFTHDKKFFFCEGYIKIVNWEKYDNYTGSKNENAKKREQDLISDSVLKYFDTLSIEYPYPISGKPVENSEKQESTNETDTLSIPHPYPSDSLRNHKSEIINKKSKIINQKSEVENLELVEIVNFYNQVFNKNITSTKGFEDNYLFWSKTHSLEKIKKAITNGRNDNFWKDKLTLAILFRRKNPRGENVDYVEELSNRSFKQFGNENNPFAVRADSGKYNNLKVQTIENE